MTFRNLYAKLAALSLVLTLSLALTSQEAETTYKAGHKPPPDDPIWFDLNKVVTLKSYRRHLKAYKPKEKILDQVRVAIDELPTGNGLHAVAYYGSWCKDSAREIPRLYKLFSELGGSIRIVPIDKKKNPLSGEKRPVSRFSVPRIHFYWNGKLIGVREVSMGGKPEKGLLKMIRKYQDKNKDSSRSNTPAKGTYSRDRS